MRAFRFKRDVYAAGLMMLIGIGTVTGSLEHDVNTLARIGPGFFPLLLGTALIGVSALMLAAAAGAAEAEPARRAPSLRAWLCVTAAVVAFIVIGRYGGLVPASFVVVLLAALGDESNSLKEALALAVGLTVLAVAIFHYGLQMQFPLFRWG